MLYDSSTERSVSFHAAAAAYCSGVMNEASAKENVEGSSPQKSLLPCFSLIPVELKMMTGAARKWFPSPAACLCVNTFNYTTLNSPFPFRMKDRCGSQPASLNQVQERRRPLKAHQSESYLPLGRSESEGNKLICSLS